MSIALVSLLIIAVVVIVVVLTWPVTYTYYYQINLKTLDTFTNDLTDPTSEAYSAFKSKLLNFVSKPFDYNASVFFTIIMRLY